MRKCIKQYETKLQYEKQAYLIHHIEYSFKCASSLHLVWETKVTYWSVKGLTNQKTTINKVYSTSATMACKINFSSLEQCFMAWTFGCVIMELRAWFTWVIDTNVRFPSSSAISADLLQISRALLASPETEATFLFGEKENMILIHLLYYYI